MEFKKLQEKLENNIKDSYENGVSMLQAERLAGEFLYAMSVISSELMKVDLDSRVRKSGVKAIRAAVYLEECQKDTKKPTEAMLSAIIDSNADVLQQQNELDEAETARDELKRLFDLYDQSHIHFRTICKGAFGA